jgi:hypothetical protein
MEEVMPELIDLVLTQYIADSTIDTVVCRAVCRQWNRLLRQHHLNKDDSKPPRRAPYATRLSVQMAERGSLAVLQWARSYGCPWDEGTCAAAAWGGHLEVLQWARSNGCPWDHYTCPNAAARGHLEMLQWARANGCPWTADTCAAAAWGGHLEVLQWARANGCPWHKGATCSNAEVEGHLDVLKWARSQRA